MSTSDSSESGSDVTEKFNTPEEWIWTGIAEAMQCCGLPHPDSDEQPGPPFSHNASGLMVASFCDSANA